MEILNQNNYKIIHLIDGQFILNAVDLINKNEADGINFNFIKNFPSDIEEIKLAPNLKHVQINDLDYDYSAINSLIKLESLDIYTTDKKEINYLNFPLLKSTAIFWRQKAKSLFDSENIERLFIGKYNEPNLDNFEKLRKLKYLRINTGSIKSLKGIEKLKSLETLFLTQTTCLEDIGELEELSNLRHLRIDNCRNIKEIDRLSDLTGIKTLEILGTTPKLKK